MKKCPNCGAEYEEDKKFCKKCGSPLSDVEQMSKEKDHQRREAGGTPPGKKRKKNVWIILTVLLAIVIFAGGIFAVYMFQEKRLEEVREEQERRERELEEEREEEEKARKKAEKKEKEKEEKEEEEQKQKEKELEEQLQKKEEELQKAQEEAEEKKKDTASSSSGGSSGMSAGEWWDSKIASVEEADTQLSAGISSGASFESQMQVEQSRYDLWDNLLNEMWAELEAVLPSEELGSLTDEQVSWIQQKEAMLSSYWQRTTVEHSSFPNGPAADLTRERVYYLRGKLPY